MAWERLPRAGRLRLGAGYTKRDARADDGNGAPGGDPDETDLSYHGGGLDVGGGVELARGRGFSVAGDMRYELEMRRYDSSRPADDSHYGREDRFYAIEFGLGAGIGPAWWVRGFYRIERNRADYGTTAPPGSEVGGYHVNQAGLVLEWSAGLWRRTTGPPQSGTPR